ncbi:protein toll-like, partial [Epargyreus clarus]|uniref:protein toll-like n=1 Tax=Epargyreus clarus TaxID=520877 RepID=UPI003C2C8EFA
ACADGRALRALAPAALCGAALPALPAAAAALGALALALAALALACLARPAGRRRIKRFLFERNLCLRWLLRSNEEDDEIDEERIYDVFVSYSHHDEEFVNKLVERLESGPRPRRLCLHYRDWMPGEWIPTQICESVRRSRRTLVVLSAHFLRSTWARAEFREAHAAALRDARPRLVVLLLEPPPPALLDHELRSFLNHNTYLRWGDPWFWDKLLHALPPAPAPPAPAAAPPAPAAAAAPAAA